LAAYVGEQVTVRYDPWDLAEVRVFHQGQFLCRAVSAELAAATISLKDLEAARNRRRRELRTELTSRRSLVDALRHPVREPVPADAVTNVERLPASLLACRTVMWTPHVLATPRELEREVEFRCGGLTDDIESAFHPDYDPELMFDFDDARHTELFTSTGRTG
jgi:Mu transposase, C-terminal